MEDGADRRDELRQQFEEGQLREQLKVAREAAELQVAAARAAARIQAEATKEAAAGQVRVARWSAVAAMPPPLLHFFRSSSRPPRLG
jgi:hypothetical protein